MMTDMDFVILAENQAVVRGRTFGERQLNVGR